MSSKKKHKALQLFELQPTKNEFPSGEPQLSPNALKLLEKRYLKRDKKGELIEEPKRLFLRVAKAIASAELQYDKKADVDKFTRDFYTLMAEGKFLPNTPTLINAGKSTGQLAACFVLPIEDSLSSIFELSLIYIS